MPVYLSSINNGSLHADGFVRPVRMRELLRMGVCSACRCQGRRKTIFSEDGGLTESVVCLFTYWKPREVGLLSGPPGGLFRELPTLEDPEQP